jgi:hypothetical protein
MLPPPASAHEEILTTAAIVAVGQMSWTALQQAGPSETPGQMRNRVNIVVGALVGAKPLDVGNQKNGEFDNESNAGGWGKVLPTPVCVVT